ncbi:MAG: hypothetical protein ABI443_01760 [Chthoniobacterales bacterium]
MSAKADDIAWLNPQVAFWQAYEPKVKTDLSSCAINFEGKLFLFDPIPLSKDAWQELTASTTPAAIILTNENHQRASLKMCEDLKIPIIAPEGARGELTADEWFSSEDATLACGFEIISLPGFALGETAFYVKQLRTLIVGDALINLPSHGFSMLPAKYCNDARTAKKSLLALRDLDLDLLCMAHGEPLRNPAGKLAAL